ncbi:hypothetical protein LQF12_13720 [Ruania suaedae]|uniref:hypothetical protein n=1 Tax=Ruania suaedae TaxID=2897774 RepID=UPI001E55D91F|nr:hypothetical protein [Ruania suaedae]UFU02537.1 hypothetical protein LQF12_13720 [Ruania suaedae]
MTDATGSTGPITEVREGMTVFDSGGEKVGTVRDIQMGDPGATTSAGQENDRGNSLVGNVADALRIDSLPEAARERLMRVGFVRVDSSGLFHRDRYAASDEIGAVKDDAVHLTVAGDHLLH